MAGEKLLCLDFDQTIVNGHFHATLASQKNPSTPPNTITPGVQVLQDGQFKLLGADPVPQGKGASPEQIQGLISRYGAKHGGEMLAAIRQALAHGHKVAILSFTLYPEVILPTLRALRDNDGSQLSEEEIRQICVIGGFPSDNKPDSTPLGKEEHIAAAVNFFKAKGVNIERSDVMLVDDTTRNLTIAQERSGLQKENCVTVPKEPNPNLANNNYFNQINAFTAANLRAQVLPQFEALASISVPTVSPTTKRSSTAILSHFQQRKEEATMVQPLAIAEDQINLGIAKATVATFSDRANKSYLKFESPVARDTAYDQMSKVLGDSCRKAGANLLIEINVLDLLKKTVGSDLPGVQKSFKERPDKIYIEFTSAEQRDAAHSQIVQVFGQEASRVATQGNRVEINPMVLLKTLETKPNLLVKDEERARPRS